MRLLFSSVILLAFAGSQPGAQQLQQRLGEVKQSIAQNQARLRTYQWVETTELSLKGEVKKREQSECRYGPDGKLQKTAIGEPAEPKKKSRGIKGRIVEKKVDEFKDYMERFGSLLSRYIPPDAAQLQQASQAGKASLDKSSGGTLASLVFNDYAKPGDKVTFTFDTAAKKLRNFNVATYLDGPEDAVGVDARFSSLQDGTNYVEEAVLTSKSKQLQIRKTNFDHKKAGQ
jgi:hypothetical protein